MIEQHDLLILRRSRCKVRVGQGISRQREDAPRKSDSPWLNLDQARWSGPKIGFVTQRRVDRPDGTGRRLLDANFRARSSRPPVTVEKLPSSQRSYDGPRSNSCGGRPTDLGAWPSRMISASLGASSRRRARPASASLQIGTNSRSGAR